MATVYRNLQEQVYENAKDIEDLQANKVDSGQVNNLAKDAMKDYGIEYNNTTKKLVFKTPVTIENPDDTVHYPLVSILGETSILGNVGTTGNLSIHEALKVNRITTYGTEKNYQASIAIGDGNSGSTLSLEAPGDNGIATLELANEYNQGSTSIKFTADKLVFGNTEITEEQLQKLLQLIQN